MSTFACPVVRVTIEPHPNADQIEIARVGDFQSIVRKGQLKTGDLACYVPEQAVLPEWLLVQMNLWDADKNKGALAGSAGNRVKAIKLRGVVSQGLVLPQSTHQEGDDMAEFLGVIKYEPPIPTHFAGRIVGADLSSTHKYDFENLKRQPDLFEDGSEVVITEKIHGTMIQIGVVPSYQSSEKFFAGRVVLSSKGLGAKGFVLDHTDETNLYVQAAKNHGLLQSMLDVFGELADKRSLPVFIVGEVFGVTQTSGGNKGIQDLIYTGKILDFRAFDICVGNRGCETYLSWDEFVRACAALQVEHVPLLFRGPYSKQTVLDYTDGPTTLQAEGAPAHIREGVVVKSAVESHHPLFGRRIAKSISNAYLLRSEATEYN